MKRLDKHFERVQENQKALERVRNCIENNEELNDWEDLFLESLEEQLTEGRTPSAAQLEKLTQIEYAVEWGREAYWEEFGQGC